MWGGLPANAVGQAMMMLDVPTPSRAGSLLELCAPLRAFVAAAIPAGVSRQGRRRTFRAGERRDFLTSGFRSQIKKIAACRAIHQGLGLGT